MGLTYIIKIKFSFSFSFFYLFSRFLNAVIERRMDLCVIVLFCFFSFLTLYFIFKNGWTPLHVAAAQGFEETVKIFIGHGANVNIQNKVFFFLFFDVLFLFTFFFLFFICLFVFVGLLKE